MGAAACRHLEVLQWARGGVPMERRDVNDGGCRRTPQDSAVGEREGANIWPLCSFSTGPTPLHGCINYNYIVLNI